MIETGTPLPIVDMAKAERFRLPFSNYAVKTLQNLEGIYIPEDILLWGENWSQLVKYDVRKRRWLSVGSVRSKNPGQKLSDIEGVMGIDYQTLTTNTLVLKDLSTNELLEEQIKASKSTILTDYGFRTGVSNLEVYVIARTKNVSPVALLKNGARALASSLLSSQAGG